MNTQEKIIELENKLDELKKECQEDKLLETFKKFVRRFGGMLAIKGEDNYLTSDSNGDLTYIKKDNISINLFDDDLHYEECNLSDLKRGDIFIVKARCKIIEDINQNAFNYFVGQDKDLDYQAELLESETGVEFISPFLHNIDKKVFKFLRE